MAFTSLLVRAATSWVWSVMMRTTSLSRLGLTFPYHFGFGTSVTDVSLTNDWTMYGPPEYVGWFASSQVTASPRPLAVVRSPCCAAMCAGYSELNMLCQSRYGDFMTTVIVLPLSEPVSDLICVYPAV